MSRRHGQTGSSPHAQDPARLQLELEAERERLRTLLDSMIDPYVLLRPMRENGTVTDLLVVDVNPAASGYLEVPPEKLLEGTLRGLVPEPYSSLLVESLGAVADTGSPLVRDGITVLSPLFAGMQRSYDVRATRVGDDVSLSWRDVTERAMAADALARSEQRFRLLAENSTDVVFRGSADSRVEWVSPSVTEVLGFEPAELLGMSSLDLVAPEDRERVLEFLSGDSDRSVRAYQARFHTKDGDPRWMSVTVRAVLNDDEIIGYVGSARDVETEKRAVDEAQYLATHDELTHLLNRRAILARLDAIVQHPPRQGGRTAVLYLDLDGLKPVNDRSGHAAGDAVLVEVGRRLQGGVRAGDVVGRLGGDEFVVVLGAVPDVAGATAVADKLRSAVREPVTVDDLVLTTTASIGIAFVHADDTTDTVMARADAALYDAKRRGKDQVQVDDADLAASTGDDDEPTEPRVVLAPRVVRPSLGDGPRPARHGAGEDDDGANDDPDVTGGVPPEE
jgi:diguanylate cyclase (GGDEF)-like protein/PAS domain S-box-containing protein